MFILFYTTSERDMEEGSGGVRSFLKVLQIKELSVILRWYLVKIKVFTE